VDAAAARAEVTPARQPDWGQADDEGGRAAAEEEWNEEDEEEEEEGWGGTVSVGEIAAALRRAEALEAGVAARLAEAEARGEREGASADVAAAAPPRRPPSGLASLRPAMRWRAQELASLGPPPRRSVVPDSAVRRLQRYAEERRERDAWATAEPGGRGGAVRPREVEAPAAAIVGVLAAKAARWAAKAACAEVVDSLAQGVVTRG